MSSFPDLFLDEDMLAQNFLLVHIHREASGSVCNNDKEQQQSEIWIDCLLIVDFMRIDEKIFNWYVNNPSHVDFYTKIRISGNFHIDCYT